ncbi:MAG: phosphotransferase family protein [Acidimicrobiales bacterium]
MTTLSGPDGTQSSVGSGPAWLAAWPIAYPHVHRSWTVRSPNGAAWATLTPETGEVEPVEPAGDRRLPGLAVALRSGRLVAYRAGRRAVVRSQPSQTKPGSFIKVVRPSRVDGVVRTHQRLFAANLPAMIPRVLQFDDDGRIGLEALPGPSVHDLFRSTSHREPSIPVEQIAEALSCVHRIEPEGNPRPDDPPEKWVAMVGRAEPNMIEPLQEVASQLPSLPAAEPAVIHGDLHDKNILLGERSIALIDLDGVKTGAAEDELANLGVHLQLRCLQSGRPIAYGQSLAARLYRRYGEIRTVSPSRIDAAERHVWFRLACLYRFRVSSRPLVPDLLHLAAGGSQASSR